jgi:hypothetical protein
MGGLVTSAGTSTFDIGSGGSGFVDTIYGAGVGEGASTISGETSQTIDPIAFVVNNDILPPYGIVTSGGSSGATATNAFSGGFSPSGSPGNTGGSGSGTGSVNANGAANVLGAGTALDANVNPFGPAIGKIAGAGAAKASSGGSATRF